MTITDKETCRVVVFLTREQIDCLDAIGNDARFTTGNKLPRTVILGMMAELICRLQIRGNGITNGEQFLDRVKDAIRGVQQTALGVRR